MTSMSVELVVVRCIIVATMSVKFIVMGYVVMVSSSEHVLVGMVGYVVMVTSSENMFGGVQRICVMSGRNAMTIMSDKVLVGMMRGCNTVTIMSVQVGVVAWSVVERLVFSMGRQVMKRYAVLHLSAKEDLGEGKTD